MGSRRSVIYGNDSHAAPSGLQARRRHHLITAPRHRSTAVEHNSPSHQVELPFSLCIPPPHSRHSTVSIEPQSRLMLSSSTKHNDGSRRPRACLRQQRLSPHSSPTSSCRLTCSVLEQSGDVQQQQQQPRSTIRTFAASAPSRSSPLTAHLVLFLTPLSA